MNINYHLNMDSLELQAAAYMRGEFDYAELLADFVLDVSEEQRVLKMALDAEPEPVLPIVS